MIRYDRRRHPYNANAGPARNAEMVAAGTDLCVAFHWFLTRSKGTQDCVRRAIDGGDTDVPDRIGEGGDKAVVSYARERGYPKPFPKR